MRNMSTKEAIATLRAKMGLKQPELAARIGVTITSISRYENGRKPNRQVLKKLAAVAEDAKLNDLRDIFAAKWKASIAARLKRLPSAGTERGVSLDDLKRWQEAPRIIEGKLREAQGLYRDVIFRPIKDNSDHRLRIANAIMSNLVPGILRQLSNSIEPYVNTPKKGKSETTLFPQKR
jgi:transcriptional regulator with XRE-family HTH domain